MIGTVYSVSQINQHVKQLMDRDRLLGGVTVRGEISNHRCPPPGHHYFSLKDEGGSISCVMFAGDAAGLGCPLVNGTQVLASGRVSVFPRDGRYQLYCRSVRPEGVGGLHAAFEALRARLEQEGLFDEAHKKPIPAMPGRVALVTSATGAAVQDMIRILGTRWPMAHVLVVSTKVQGEGAAEEIAAAIDRADREGLADVIVTGRGGGSMEDLWAFNEEAVARAIYRCRTPVISAVGHEPDVTIADYVADRRASTPSNAAELAAPDQREVRARLDELGAAMARAVARKLGRGRERLNGLARRRALTDMRAPIEDKRLRLAGAQRRMGLALQGAVAVRREVAGRLAASLDALSPLRVLGRGYAIAQADGRPVTSTEQVRLGDRVDVWVEDGTLECTVTGKEKGPWKTRS